MRPTCKTPLHGANFAPISTDSARMVLGDRSRHKVLCSCRKSSNGGGPDVLEIHRLTNVWNRFQGDAFPRRLPRRSGRCWKTTGNSSGLSTLPRSSVSSRRAGAAPAGRRGQPAGPGAGPSGRQGDMGFADDPGPDRQARNRRDAAQAVRLAARRRDPERSRPFRVAFAEVLGPGPPCGAHARGPGEGGPGSGTDRPRLAGHRRRSRGGRSRSPKHGGRDEAEAPARASLKGEEVEKEPGVSNGQSEWHEPQGDARRTCGAPATMARRGTQRGFLTGHGSGYKLPMTRPTAACR